MAGDIDFESILSSISDEKARQGFRLLLNLVEQLVAENRALREEVQRLRDENNRLKGEQGKPQFKAGKGAGKGDKAAKPVISAPRSTDHSSEKERRQPKEGHKGSKVDRIVIDREEFVKIDPALLPADAVRKGYEEVIVQDIEIKTDNICFLKEKWYSPSTGKTYLADLPKGYAGQYGPGIKALALSLYFGGNMSQAKILEFFRNAGLFLSEGSLCAMLLGSPSGSPSGSLRSSNTEANNAGHQNFDAEYDAIYRAGLKSSVWQGTDHTPTRVNGQEHQCQVVGNSLYSIYATTEKKDRLSILDVLCNRHRPRSGQNTERTYLLNAQAYRYLDAFKLSGVIRGTLKDLLTEELLPESVFLGLLEEHLPQLTTQQFNTVCDAAAIAAYRACGVNSGVNSGGDSDWPVIPLLLCDDAPAFKNITDKLALCWVHDGRFYRKLTPFVSLHRELLERFREQYWKYYDRLLAYREHPRVAQKRILAREFDELFSQITGYDELDKRIARSRAKKESLLMVLDYPSVPLHNNDAELAARTRVRKRDVSFGPRSREGIRAWDTFMSLQVTARKLGVNFYHYLYDRISETFAMPALATLIEQQSANPPHRARLAAA